MSSSQTAAVVLAAGKSTRMKSDLPKVMHEVCGLPMLRFVFDACRQAGIERIVVVVGYQKDCVIRGFANDAGLRFVEQIEQKGTGHAVLMARDALADFNGRVIVIAGDMPLIRGATLQSLIDAHGRTGATASLATTTLDNPFSYGRIVRDERGEFLGIVEEKDCTDAQRAIREVNPSYYCFERAALFSALQEVRPNNAKNEYYITDALKIIRERGGRVTAETSVPAIDATGINSRADLAQVAALMQRRIQAEVMDQAVTLVAPHLTWIEARATIGPESVIHPFTYVGAFARIGRGCEIGPFARVERGATVEDGRTVAGRPPAGSWTGEGAAVSTTRVAAALHAERSV